METPAQVLKAKMAQFDADMFAAEPERLRQDWCEIRAFAGHRDFSRSSNRIMWRMINAAKKARDSGRDDRCSKMMLLLTEFMPGLEVDNENRKAALGFAAKYDMPFSSTLNFLLAQRGNYDKAPASVRTKLREIKDFYRNSDDFSLQSFTDKTSQYLRLLADRDTDVKLVHFSALYTMLQRRTQIHGSPVQVNLFDERLRQADTVDKGLVKATAQIFAQQLVEAGDIRKISNHYVQKFGNMMTAVVSKNSFSREEVKRLAKGIKQQRWVSRSVEETLNNLANRLVDVYDYKQEKEIRGLNQWFDREKKQRPIEQAAQRAVYVNMLHRKFIEDYDIGGEKYDALYREEKSRLGKEIVSRYSRLKAAGAEPDKEDVQRQVLNESREKAQDKFQEVNLMMNKRCVKCSFFFKVLSNANSSGLKYIYPPTLLEKNNSRYFH